MKRTKQHVLKARVTMKMRKALRDLAISRDESVSVLIREAITAYIAKELRRRR